MTIVCEPVCNGDEHAPVNSALLKMLAISAQNPVTFIAEASHIECVKSQIGELELPIHFRQIQIPDRRATFKSRIARELKIASIIRTLAREDPFPVLFTAVAPSTLYVIRTMLANACIRISVNAILHGELASVSAKQPRSPFARFSKLKAALQYSKSKHIRFIVLENGIRSAFLNLMPSFAPLVRTLEHPLPLLGTVDTAAVGQNPLRFCFLGRASTAKGFLKFVEAASFRYESATKPEFHAIGSSEDASVSAFDLKSLATQPTSGKIERQRYEEKLASMHFACFPYEQSHYGLSASGALLDAVAFQKPLLAASIPLFRNLFERFGDIGYLVDESECWGNAVLNVVETFDADRFEEQRRNLRRVGESRDLSLLAETYRHIGGGSSKRF